jgi:beta-catenin-like protein 1
LLPLAQFSSLAYPEIIRSGAVSLLVGLLSHENVDIVIDAVEVFHELTDEDVGDEGDEEQGESQDALKILIDALVSQISPVHAWIDFAHLQVQNSVLELLVDNLSRLNEAEESDRQGVFHIIGKIFPCIEE